MKVLVVHNFYQQPGGEDHVFAAETEVLRAHGHDVETYTVHNDRIATIGRLTLASSTIWNGEIARELGGRAATFGPDIVHFHNTFPLVSPAAYTAVRRLGIPVVQTLHNFRLLCVNALFLRNNHPCEDCLGRAIAWPGVLHGCYRDNRPASAVVAGMLAFHRWRGTWRSDVDTYIAVSEFARRRFVAGGLPGARIVVKPNFLPRDPGPGEHAGRYALYVGRLSHEKGLPTLVEAWRRLGETIPLRIIGVGPLETLAADSPRSVQWLGWQAHDQVLAAMKDASFLVFPTECYEGFPIVLLEAMATGLPVLASRQGGIPEMLKDGAAGKLIQSGDVDAWVEAVRWALRCPEELAALGRQARQVFVGSFTPELGYQHLSDIYRRTLERAAPVTGRDLPS